MPPITKGEDRGRDHPQFQKLLKSLSEVAHNANDNTEGFPEIEKIISKPHNDRMTEPISRPELDAKLETIEVRMDGRLARIEDSIQRIVDMTAEIKEDYREIRSDNRDIRQSVSSLKTTMIVTAIGAALTIVLGVAAFNATLQSNMLNAFQAGWQTSQPSPPPPAK